MFKAFGGLIVLKNILSRLLSIDKSLTKLAETAELQFKLDCILENVDPLAVKEAFIDKGIDSEDGEGVVLQQTPSELKEIDDAFNKFKEVMGREPVGSDSLDYIKKMANKEPK